jgi:hypothetical protein
MAGLAATHEGYCKIVCNSSNWKVNNRSRNRQRSEEQIFDGHLRILVASTVCLLLTLSIIQVVVLKKQFGHTKLLWDANLNSFEWLWALASIKILIIVD